MKEISACLIVFLLVVLGGNNVGVKGENNQWLPNLHHACLDCICAAASGCDGTRGCEMGYCGPFAISRIYWVEAGRPVLPDDDPERVKSYEDCANVYWCAEKIVTAYMIKLAKDCNDDGTINCDDFVLMHGNGGYNCNQSLNRTEKTRAFKKRYDECRGFIGDEELRSEFGESAVN